MRWKLVFAGLVWGLAADGTAAAHFNYAALQPGLETGVAQPRRPPLMSPVSNPAPSDYVEIDGGKNPDLIPQWSTWAFAFRVIAGGSKLIPTVVLRHLSKDEAALLLAAAEADQQSDAACQERVLRLRPLLATEKADVINRKTREIQLDCRWQTLHTRDRVLAALSADARTALIQWVESTKSGMHVSVPKRELAHYQQPQ